MISPRKFSVEADGPFGPGFDDIMETRRQEADEFYAAITPPAVGEDAAMVMRQALAGMLWSKQYYYFDAITWLGEHGAHPLKPHRQQRPQPGMVPHGE